MLLDKLACLLYRVHKDSQTVDNRKGVEMKVRSGNKTFSELMDRYMTEHSKPHKRSWKHDQRYLDLHLLPFFGKIMVSAIGYP